MPGPAYLFRLNILVVFGIISLIISAFIFWLFLPVLIKLFAYTVIILGIFVVLWLLVYAAMILGAAVYYIFKPMELAKEEKKYSISKAVESGRRQKGKSR